LTKLIASVQRSIVPNMVGFRQTMNGTVIHIASSTTFLRRL